MSPLKEKSQVPSSQARGKSNLIGIRAFGGHLYGRSARVAKPKQTGYLVKGLAGRVIQRVAKALVIQVIRHQVQLCVAPGHQQGQQREPRFLRGRLVGAVDPWRIHVSLEMVHANQRQAPPQCQPFSGI